jgi:dolichol-phosphate mannosyltransferase
MSEQVSVILPTYNERDNIVPLIAEIQSHLGSLTHEIIVVDDNSPDGTAQVVRERFVEEPQVRVIVRTEDPSLAKSIGCGLREAKGDLLIVMDTDFNHPPVHVPFMVEALKWYDCVSGSRYLFGGGMVPFRRLLMSWMFNVFVRLMTRGRMTDNLYGFLAMRASVLKALDFETVFYGYGDYCIRLLYYLQRNGVSILQFPVMNGRRRAGQANSAMLATFCEYTAATLRLALKGLKRPCTRK